MKKLSLTFVAVLMLAVRSYGGDIRQIKESTYLCANSLRYFDGVAVAQNKVITGIEAIPQKYRKERITLYGLNGVTNYGRIVKITNGIAAIETETPLPRWVSISYQPPTYGEPIMVVSAKWAYLNGYFKRGLLGRGYGEVIHLWRGSNHFATTTIANTGAGIYDSNDNLIGLCWGYGPDFGIALAFGIFH